MATTNISEPPVLLDTSLCAIVRDEKMNPAGGVERWLHATLPYVEEAVVVDTGSVDGTREILEEMKSKYRHLKVYNHKWRGFADARNRSLKEADTKYVLVLDADDIIADENKSIAGGFRQVQKFMEASKHGAYRFDFHHLTLPGEGFGSVSTHTTRLFIKSDFHYIREVRELLMPLNGGLLIPYVKIRHFLPSKDAIKKKNSHWYTSGPDSPGPFMNTQPIESAEEHGWKEYNPRRDKFK